MRLLSLSCKTVIPDREVNKSMKFIIKLKISVLTIISLLSLSTILHADILKPQSSGYINVSDGKLYYQTFGTGTPIIVLHGGPGLDQGYLLPQMANLAHDHEVTFYDQRGCGKSLGFNLTPQTINIDTFVQDLESVRNKLHYKKFILIGHSWGGLLAMNYAIKYPDHLSGVILLSSAPSNSTGFELFIQEYVRRTVPLKATLDSIAATEKFKTYDHATIEDYYRTIFSVYFFKPEEVKNLSLTFTDKSAASGLKVQDIFSHNYFNNYDVQNGLRKLNTPVLIVHGEEDLIPLSTAKETKAVLPNVQMVTIKDCDHFPYIEQPQTMFSAIKKFVAENDK